MGNGLRELKETIREGAGAMESIKKRQTKQSEFASDLGLEDPYKKKKKKKKENEGGTFRSFMDKYIGAKEKKNNAD